MDTPTPSSVPATLRPPRGVIEIASRLERAGHETWCVGGAVRDALLGIPNLDWDLATAARPEQVRAAFRRTIPVGLDFGTVAVFDADGVSHEVTTFRRDVQTDGRHAVVEFGASLRDDLARRDFTINAIAYSPSREEIRDPFGGRLDLERRVVRAVGDAAARMREDRLRALRGIRFAARLGFDIEPATWAAIVDSAPHLGRLSAERVKEELAKTMRQIDRPSAALRRWQASGAFETLIPSLARVDDVTLRAVDCLARPTLERRPHRLDLRLAALWSSATRSEVEFALRALRFSNADVRFVADLVGHWAALGDRVRDALGAAEGPPDVEIRQWARATGRLLVAPLLRLAAARFAAERAPGVAAPTAIAVRRVYRRAVRIAYRDPIALGDLAVDGNDLAKHAGIAAGPEVGRILSDLLEVVVNDPAQNRRDRLLALARTLRTGEESEDANA